MRSIQQRLSLGLAAILLVAGLLFAQTSLWLFDEGLRRYLESQLRDESQTLLSALARGPAGIGLDPVRISAAYNQPFSGHYFVIQMPATTWRSRSFWDHPLNLPTSPGLQKTLADGPQQQHLLVYRAHYRRFGQDITIITAQDYTPVMESFSMARWVAATLGFSCLVIVLVMQRLLVRRSLQPLEDTRHQIEQLQRGQRSALDTDVPAELAPLVQQVNNLLRHTEDTLKRSRNALGNLGHALKTPLAVLFSLSNRSELAAHPELRDNLSRQLESMQQRIGRELARARLAGEALPGAYFDCDREIPDLLATLRQIHNPQLQVNWQAPDGLLLPWDREDMLELLGNLLDNACKWAMSRVETRISVTPELSYQH